MLLSGRGRTLGFMVSRYVLLEEGRAFGSRSRGVEVRAEIEALATDADEVLIDFAAVRRVGPSFADEVAGACAIAYAAGELTAKPVFVGLSEQSQEVLLGVMRLRGVSREISAQLIPH
jgi:hypothetical protein